MRVDEGAQQVRVPELQPVRVVEVEGQEKTRPGDSPVTPKEQQEGRLASILERQPLAKIFEEEGFDISFQLSFTFHKETKELIVKVIDPDTGKVIREIPPEELLELALRIQEMVGLLIDRRV